MASEFRRDLIILAAASLLFLFSSQVLSFVGPIFASPDETANAFFAETFAAQGKLYSFEPLNTVLGDVLFPRSLLSIDGRILPISFVGLPLLFGGLIKLFGFWSLSFWTPLFAILAVFAWYAIFRQWFNRQIGFWSALLLLITPAWWYWSARPLMHNVLAVSFLIFSVFFLAVRPIKQKFKTNSRLDYVLAGLMLSASLWIRASEIFWLVPLAIFVLLITWKKISWSAVLFFLVTLIISLAPMLFLNNSLYGNYFSTGYTAVSSVVNSVDVNYETQNFTSLRDRIDSILPFGFHPRAALRNVWHYGLFMFWWLTIPAAVGLWVVWRRGVRAQYFVPLLVAAAILGIVYGSSAIHDNPDASAITIGNSYSRYWLPLFVAITPLIAMALVKLSEWNFFKKIKKIVLPVCFVIFFALSFNLVFLSSDDALWPMRQRSIIVAAVHERVLELTEPEAVIIVDRADKLFFPDRRVRYPLRDETTYGLMPKLAAEVPLYYYGITFPQSDLDYLNNEKLKGLGLQIDFVESFGGETLYRISFLQ